jgi:predicted nucleic acid-binding protein
MNVRALVDTNVLVYSYDRADPAKQQQALVLLDQLIKNDAGALSTQILGEFVVTVTRKPSIHLPLQGALDEAGRYLKSWTVFDVTKAVVEEAIRGVRTHQLNYWDAQIWAVARVHHVPVLLSADFQDGRTLEGVRFLDPLAPGFQPAELLK